MSGATAFAFCSRRTSGGQSGPCIAHFPNSRVFGAKFGGNRIARPTRPWLQSHETRSPALVVRDLLRSLLPIALLIATASRCGPLFGDESPARLPADLTVRVDGLFAKWNRLDSPGCAVGIVHRG